MYIISSGKTDIGNKRKNNEDSFCIADDVNLYVVADGMGGHLAGETASRTAADIIANFIKTNYNNQEITWPFGFEAKYSREANLLKSAIELANQRVFQMSREIPEYKGMGTTAVAMLFSAGKVCIAHVGDSRAYKITDTSVAQLTRDHSMFAEQFGDSPSQPENYFTEALKNMLTRGVGVSEEVEPDVTEFQWQANDIYLLCSDGLSNYISGEEMQVIVKQFGNKLDAACDALIRLAKDRGGADNITVILAQVQ